MNALLKVSLALVVVAIYAATSFAGGYGVGKAPVSNGGYYYPAQAYSYYNPAQTTVAQVQPESRRAFSYEVGSLQYGDSVVIAKPATELKLGNQVLAKIPQGTRLSVINTRDIWVGTSVVQNGHVFTGWVLASDLNR